VRECARLCVCVYIISVTTRLVLNAHKEWLCLSMTKCAMCARIVCAWVIYYAYAANIIIRTCAWRDIRDLLPTVCLISKEVFFLFVLISFCVCCVLHLKSCSSLGMLLPCDALDVE
jgi:hypothetical protein